MHPDCALLPTGRITHYLMLAREVANAAAVPHIDAALLLVRRSHHRSLGCDE